MTGRLVIDVPPEVSVGALGDLPDDQERWFATVLGLGAEIVERRQLQTVDGWSLALILARAGDEARAGAFYAFLEHGAHVLLRATDLDALTALVEKLLPALRAARPELAGVASLADFFGPDVTDEGP